MITLKTYKVDQVDSIMVTTERLCNNSSNTQEVVRQTKSLAQVSNFYHSKSVYFFQDFVY